MKSENFLEALDFLDDEYLTETEKYTNSEATGTFEVSAERTMFIEILPSNPESIEAEFNSQRDKILP